MKSILTNEIMTVNLALLTLAIDGLKNNPVMHRDPGMNRFSLNKRQADELSHLADGRIRQISRCGRSLFVPVRLNDEAGCQNNAHYSVHMDGMITHYYYDLLVLIREASRTKPFEAVWRFGLSMDDLNHVANTSLADLKKQSNLSALKLCILPKNASGTVSPRFHAVLYDWHHSAIRS